MDSTGTLEILNGQRGAWVALGWSQEVLRGRIVPAYVVTTSTGYRAIFEACQADDCLSASPDRRTPCPIPTIGLARGEHAVKRPESWRAHSRTQCHAWHEESVRTMAQRVLKTYGSGPSKPQVGVALKDYPTWAWAKSSPA